MSEDVAAACRRLRREDVRAAIERRGLSGIIVRRPPNFAWYTSGADNRVDHSSPSGVASVLITPDAEYVLADSIEAPRMRAEETPGYEVVEFPWFDGPTGQLDSLVDRSRLGSDLPEGDEADVSAALLPLRRVLDEDAIARYRTVGADTMAAMQEVAEGLQPGVDEWEIAGRLLAACASRGLYVPVVMAAGDDRIEQFRHAIPHRNRCTRRIMLVVCAERGGLYANLTRFVEFEEPSAEITRRMDAARTILLRMREEATQPGRTLADAFAECRRFYAEAGFPEEWRKHHQGGSTGYATREVVATPHTLDAIVPNQAFAWNPSITGGKAEETFLLTEDGPEVLAGWEE